MKNFNKLYSLLSQKEKNQILYFVFFLLVATLLEVISISLIFPSLTFIIDSSDKSRFGFILDTFPILKSFSTTDLLFGFILIFLGINLLKASFLIFFTYWRNDFVFNLDKNIHCNLYKKYVGSSLIYFTSKNSSAFSKNIIQESKKIRASIDAYLKIFTEFFIIISISIVLIIYQPIPSLLILTFFSFFGLLTNKILRNRLHKLGLENVIQMEKVFKNLKDVFGLFKDIKIRDNRDYFLNKFSFYLGRALRTFKYLLIISDSVKIIFELLAILFFCVLIFLLIKINIQLKDIIPAVALFAAAAYKFLPAISRVIIYFQQIQSMQAAVDLLHRDLKRKSSQEIKKNKIKFPFKKEIVFKNVSFKYQGASKYVFKKFNLKIKKNDFICISGESGKGKTTFLNLISGLIKPTSGKILVDKVDIENNIGSWITNIGYVQQKVYLMDDTIKNNIIFDGEKPNNKKLNYAIKSAQLNKLIKSKKEGINFKVGDDGSKLSGGQIQRIGIARSLYLLPGILICDEISSSLDKDTEKRLISSLMSLRNKLTIIFITHRPNIFKSKFIKKFELYNDLNWDTKLRKIN